jgi:hypothetical protein
VTVDAAAIDERAVFRAGVLDQELADEEMLNDGIFAPIDEHWSAWNRARLKLQNGSQRPLAFGSPRPRRSKYRA